MNVQERGFENVLTAVAHQLGHPKHILLISENSEVWRSEIQKIFFSSKLATCAATDKDREMPLEGQNTLVVLDVQPATWRAIPSLTRLLSAASIVVVRCSLRATNNPEHPSLLHVGRTMAAHNLHVFDLGDTARDNVTGFLKSMDVVFLPQKSVNSPLNKVPRCKLYSKRILWKILLLRLTGKRGTF